MQNQYLAGLATEQVNRRSLGLDAMNGLQIAKLMNAADAEIPAAVATAAEPIGKAIEVIAGCFRKGGRLFYIGTGTSGRLGVLDASECPPTFGVSPEMVIGIIAGGDQALRSAIEGAEDDTGMAKNDLSAHHLGPDDAVCAISASGFAPYCVGGLRYAAECGATTISLCCNLGAQLSRHADIAIEIPTGPEVLSGSTRLKAGTATKMVLNMLTTGAMVLTGRVYQNLMVDLQPTNTKLRDRSIRIMMHALSLGSDEAAALYEAAGRDIKAAIVIHKTGATLEAAKNALQQTNGFVNRAIELLR